MLEPLRFWSGGRGGGEVPQKGKKAKNDYSAIADIFQYILVESLRNVKLGFKNRNLLFFNCQNTKVLIFDICLKSKMVFLCLNIIYIVYLY